MIIDFEDLEKRCNKAVESEAYALLTEKVEKAKKIFLLGNGGLHYVASHMATDLSRLIPDKTVYSFDSVGFITSNANDHGYEQLFVRWLDTTALVENPDDCLVVGLSCSGNSANVINAVHWADDQKFATFMISGQPSEALREGIDELSCDCQFFHTTEVMMMMLFYEMIHRTGNTCPSIRGEKNRLKDSPLRKAEE